MNLVDWRELYASNQAVIQRAGGPPSGLPAAVGRPSPRAGGSRPETPGGRGLRFDVHAPPGLERGATVPLVCLLHGCTQDAAEIAAATRMNEAAERHGFVVVYPEQGRGQNAQGCWNWFLPGHQARGAGEPAAIAARVREVMDGSSPWTIDRGRVFVAGLSAGGAMAAILAATYPDLFAALAVHSGLAYGSATAVGDAFAVMSRGADERLGRGDAVHAAMGERARVMPTMVIHGTADRTVAPLNADRLLAQFMAANRLAAPEACGDLDADRPSGAPVEPLDGRHRSMRDRWTDDHGRLVHERIRVEGLGHAWSGGAPGHRHTDPEGPDATEAIWRFFAEASTEPPRADGSYRALPARHAT